MTDPKNPDTRGDAPAGQNGTGPAAGSAEHAAHTGVRKPAGDGKPAGDTMPHPDADTPSDAGADPKVEPARAAAGAPPSARASEPPATASSVDPVTAKGSRSETAAGGAAQTGITAAHGMFGVVGTGDTSGYGGLLRHRTLVPPTPRPYGGYFDEVVDGLEAALTDFTGAIESVVVDRGELTLHVRPDAVAEVAGTLRDDPALRFELCSSVSGVDYLGQENRLHVVYQLTSMTYRRRIRLEAAVPVEDPHLPTVTALYPTADWQERETYDMFGIVFDGHPEPDPDPHAGRLGGPPAAQGLPARWGAGGVQGRRDSTA